MKKPIMKKSWFLFSLLVLVSIIASACSAGPTPAPTETAAPPTEAPSPTAPTIDYSNLPFVGKTWYWLGTELSDGTKIDVGDPTLYTIQFNADGTLNGKADCNQYNAAYTVEGESLTITMGASTLAACPPDSQSDDFLKELSQVASYIMQDSSLNLALAQDDGTMGFSEEPVAPVMAPIYADQPLVDKMWQWLRLEMSDGSVTTVPNPSAYTIMFNSDGTMNGQADCNSFSGSYTVDGASLSIQVGPVTLAACPEGSLSDQFLARLGEVATYVMDNGALVLNLKLDSGNMVFGEEPVAVLPEPAPGAPAAQATANVNVRSGPDTNYPVYGVMPVGRQGEVVGKNQDGTWWAISVPLAPLGQGWVSGDFVSVTGVENVPVLPTPPLPPTAEFTPPGPNDPQVSALDAVYIRSGPSVEFPAYGVAQTGANGLLIGRSQDGQWWVVRINPSVVSTGFGWAPTAYTVAKNVPQDLPVVEAPPLPPSVALPTPPAGTASGVAMTAVNIRSGPGLDFSVLAVAPAGAVGEITGKSADSAWWQVRVPNTISADGFGWVSAAYVYAFNATNVPVVGAPASPTSTSGPVVNTLPPTSGTPLPPYGTVKIGTTNDTVNLRAGPGSQYKSYGLIAAGTSGVIVDQNSEATWYAFKIPTSVAEDGKGWISALYVKVQTVNSATATAMATPINLPSATKTPGAGATSQPPVTNACKILEKKPADNTTYKPNFDFDMKAALENTSDSSWDVNAVDVKFVKALDNVEIHTSPSTFDLPQQVDPDDDITLYVDMKAPSSEGTYGETWALVQGNTTLCQWSFTIKVVKP